MKASRAEAPAGIVTMLFTDIEGSSDSVRALGADRWETVLEHHTAIIRTTLDKHSGFAVRTEGDSFFAVFATPSEAELGEHRFKDLGRPQRIYQLVIDGLPDSFPALRSLDSTPNNLPTQTTTFIGRARELLLCDREWTMPLSMRHFAKVTP